MTAKIQSNVGFIGSYNKAEKNSQSGVSDLNSQRLYVRSSTAVDVYGYQGHVAHATHTSTSVTGTLQLGTAYGNREVYIVIIAMQSSTSTTTNTVSSVTIGGTSLASSNEIYELNPSATTANNIGISIWRYADAGALGTSAAYTVNYAITTTHSAVFAFTTSSTATSNIGSYGVSTSGSGWGSSGTVSTAGGGFVLYAAMAQNSATPSSQSVSGYTQEVTFDSGSDEHVVLAYQTITNGGSVSVPAPSYTATLKTAFAAISRGP